jgi:PTH1 family peptidyl-tRNA hydrolase
MLPTANRKGSPPTWLIVGLGNPGPRYVYTRHNLGFLVLGLLVERGGIPLHKHTLEADWGKGRLGGEGVILAQPNTYMNLSGRAVAKLLHFFKLPLENLVVIHDDLDVPPGRLKLALGGGAGGHRGVLSIQGALGSPDFYRVKLGIGRPPADMPSEGFVLSPLAPEEEEAMADLVERGAEAVATLITQGLAVAQNHFHGVGNSRPEEA